MSRKAVTDRQRTLAYVAQADVPQLKEVNDWVELMLLARGVATPPKRAHRKKSEAQTGLKLEEEPKMRGTDGFGSTGR